MGHVDFESPLRHQRADVKMQIDRKVWTLKKMRGLRYTFVNYLYMVNLSHEHKCDSVKKKNGMRRGFRAGIWRILTFTAQTKCLQNRYWRSGTEGWRKKRARECCIINAKGNLLRIGPLCSWYLKFNYNVDWWVWARWRSLLTGVRALSVEPGIETLFT